MKAQRGPGALAACQQRLAALHQAGQRGAVAACCADEVRFRRQAPVPCAWQRRGQPPVEPPAERGATGGCPVLGFWQPGGPQATGQQAFTGRLSHAAFAAELSGAAVNEWVADLGPPAVLVPADAPVHKAHPVQQQVAERAACGRTRLFLPPCSPELNRIEILWRFCKHCWLTPAAYQTPETLLQAVSQLMHDIGTADYWITFA